MERDYILQKIADIIQRLIHDYNNKLTSIEGNLSLIKSKTQNLSVIDDINDIYEVISSIKNYRQELQKFYSYDNSRFNAVDLNSVIEKIITQYKNKLKINFEKITLPLLMLNNLEIEYLINELLTNTYIHCGPMTEVYIKTDTDLKNVLLIYEDRGKGVDNNIEIFIPFYTTNKSRKGLGLSYIWGITRRNSIGMNVVSEVGKYLRFEFIFTAR